MAKKKTPDEGQVVLVYCPSFCPEMYQVATYEDGQFRREPNGNMTEDVEEWIPIEKIEKLFKSNW